MSLNRKECSVNRCLKQSQQRRTALQQKAPHPARPTPDLYFTQEQAQQDRQQDLRVSDSVSQGTAHG